MAASFKQAIDAAIIRYPGNQWLYMDNAEQTRAIYREMQRLDLEQFQPPGPAMPPGSQELALRAEAIG